LSRPAARLAIPSRCRRALLGARATAWSLVNELARREYRKTNRFAAAARTGASADVVGRHPALAVRRPRRPAAAHPRGNERISWFRGSSRSQLSCWQPKKLGSSGESVGASYSSGRGLGFQQESIELAARRVEGTLFGLSDERIHERPTVLVEEAAEHALNGPPSQGWILLQAADDLPAQGAQVIAMQP
jgi:hypothetical protein